MDKKKVLLVDDEPDIVDTIKFNLEFEGFECVAAHDGFAAVEKAHEEMPNLIILDVRLPKKNGYQVCRLLKFDPKFKHIPIIMLTARTQEADIQTGKTTGADEYMTKPFDMNELVQRVKNYLQ